MDKEIKERIAAINSGIIPEGYKETKVGIVPVEWEGKKLKDLCDRIGDGIHGTPVYNENGTYYFINGNNIQDGKIMVTQSTNKVDYNEFEKYQKPLGNNSILLSINGTIGNTAFYNYESIILGKSAAYLNLKSSNNKYYYFYSLNSAYVQSHFSKELTGSTIKNLSLDTIKETFILSPPLPEQQKIAEILSTQDKLIELQEKKIEKLKELKKAYLQKMFPQKGSKYPELRFKGFTEAWEQHKVTELGEIYIGLVTTMTSHYTDRGALLIRNSDIKDSRFEFGDNSIYLDEEFAKQNASRKHKVGDVITVHTGDIGTSAVITEKEADSIGFATIVTRPYKDKITSEYLCTYLNTDTHKNFAMNISTGDGRNNYNLKDYYECVVPVPSLDEQNKISDFIKTLNMIITLHQRKSEQEKQKKKALMQLLLTGIVRTK